MQVLFWIFVLSGIVLGLSYLITIARYCYGWKMLGLDVVPKDETVDVAIVVAVRNEERCILECLDSLLAQDYPQSLTQIIVVDDHSDDATFALAEGYAYSYKRLKVLRLPADRTGKKEAIAYAIGNSKSELIVTTDGDCVMGAQWLSSIVSHYKAKALDMVVGPVAFHRERSVFQKLQSLEFIALIASGAGSLFFKKAIMCNGANLAFSRKRFEAVSGYEGAGGKASGDDVLLMYKFNDLGAGKVGFLKKEAAIVYTGAKTSLREFFFQRKRWASKGFLALNAESKRVSLLVFLFSAWLVLVPVSGYLCFRNTAFHPIFLGICVILVGIKCLIDFLLLFLSASFFKKKALLLYFIPEQLIYLVYVVIFGLIGPLGTYEWKGRKTN